MTIIFNGREYAAFRQTSLAIQVYKLKNQGITPKLVSILIGDDPASKLYVSLKEKKAKQIGAEMEVYEMGVRKDAEYIVRLIKFLNDKPDVHGIMVQLPLPKRLKHATEEIINAIKPQKDVDGLRADSPYVHPTVMACVQILDDAVKLVSGKVLKSLPQYPKVPVKIGVYVIGANGMVGVPLVKQLKKIGYTVIEIDKDTKNPKKLLKRARYIISTTGNPNSLTKDLTRAETKVIIDVGSPKADVDFEAVAPTTRFITPVPAGVGPVTITYLLENLLAAAYNTV
ncbi:MAG: bifunctional 5,10-methylenetetrahydrofolate dehydrogenase/5,10-methenyltetrahydrofolate cyclohydrolase [Patescibacteria group bacterium]